jgi:serine/threonine-protein kinase
MALTPGSRIGPYEIAEPIGAGGMGEVFRAVDVNLGRAAAIKVLPSSVARDPERLARFEREAQTLGALNHPHIAQVFGFEKGSGDFRAIAMELVEGPTLAERIATAGPIPVDDAIQMALQIAEALESAHDLGIVHRDLKPGNIKVRPDGTIKVLDFGLAKALFPSHEPSSGALTNSPTITTPAMTQAGVVLGTAAYMSPEQAKGRVVDRRADIWAFGCVLFEMLTGKRAFPGSDVSEVMVSILRDEPDWSAMPAATPPHVRSLLERCLQKDVRKRLPHIGVARLELSEPPRAATPTRERSRIALVAITAASVVIALGATAVLLSNRRAPVASEPVRLRVDLGIDHPAVVTSTIAVSPDGRVVAFPAIPVSDEVITSSLYVRTLDRLDAQLLPGTAGATAPFFSPDGAWIAFHADGQLKKISLDGGRVVSICDAPVFRGAGWGDDDSIVFAAADGLRRVPAAGGSPELIVEAKSGEPPPFWPRLLPGARSVLYTTATGSDPASGTILVRALPDGPTKEVMQGGRYAEYQLSGHITFMRSGTMFAVPFDLATLETKGPAVPVAEGIGQTPVAPLPMEAVSATGTLIYHTGSSGPDRQSPIVWLSQFGEPTPLRAVSSLWAFPRFSPDGRRLAMSIFDGRQADVWVYDWERDIMTRVTADPAFDLAPVWTPDGSGLVFGSTRGTGTTVANLFWQRADGTGQAVRLTEAPQAQLPDGFDPAGRFLVFHQGDPSTSRQSLMLLPIEQSSGGVKAATPTTYIGGSFLKANARISPDGKWIAYAANDTGRFEIYVEAFPGHEGRTRISNEGGSLVMWSPTKSELYYAGSDESRMMVVPYSIKGSEFVPARPARWSETRFSAAPPVTTYGPGLDLHPDGQRFAVMPMLAGRRDATLRGAQIVVVFNFFDELRRLAPIR